MFVVLLKESSSINVRHVFTKTSPTKANVNIRKATKKGVNLNKFYCQTKLHNV